MSLFLKPDIYEAKQSVCLFLNQAYANLWPVHDWFPKIAFVHDIGMYMYISLPLRLLLANGMMWHDINLIGLVGYSWYWYSRCALRLLITSSMMSYNTDPYDWLNKFYSLCMYMVAEVVIINRHCHTIEAHHRNQSKRVSYWCISHYFSQ